jgi:hypothetical protein
VRLGRVPCGKVYLSDVGGSRWRLCRIPCGKVYLSEMRTFLCRGYASVVFEAARPSLAAVNRGNAGRKAGRLSAGNAAEPHGFEGPE